MMLDLILIYVSLSPEPECTKEVTFPNHDSLHATTGLMSLLSISLWECTYYLDYRNIRPNFVNTIWDIVGGGKVEERPMTAAK